MKVGDLVAVSPDATGVGRWISGVITKIELFAGMYYYHVSFVDEQGGIVVSNVRLLEKR